MRLKSVDVNRVSFEKKLKTWLIQRSLGQIQDSWFSTSWGAQRALQDKVPAFEEGTRQLMLRSKIGDLTKLVLALNNPKDVAYYAELGDDVDTLSYVSDEAFKAVIPTLLARANDLRYLGTKVVGNTDADKIRDLYERCKVEHRELLSAVIGDARCPLDIFVDVINALKKDDKFNSLTSEVIRRLEEHLRNRDVVVSWKGGLNANRESSAA